MASRSLKLSGAAIAAALALTSCAYANSGRPPTQTSPAPGASVTPSTSETLAGKVPADLKEASNIGLDRKVLSDLAIRDEVAFNALVRQAQEALKAKAAAAKAT